MTRFCPGRSLAEGLEPHLEYRRNMDLFICLLLCTCHVIPILETNKRLVLLSHDTLQSRYVSCRSLRMLNELALWNFDRRAQTQLNLIQEHDVRSIVNCARKKAFYRVSLIIMYMLLEYHDLSLLPRWQSPVRVENVVHRLSDKIGLPVFSRIHICGSS